MAFNNNSNQGNRNNQQNNQRQNNHAEVVVKSSYNFLPPAKKVFYPDWADKVSHDIPFSDGLCGKIELSITAKSPIYIRNAHTKAMHKAYSDWISSMFRKFKNKNEANDNNYIPFHSWIKDKNNLGEIPNAVNDYLEFSKDKDKYFLPSTSVKGMIRNVLEIISASKLNIEFIDDNKFALRDLRNESYKQKVLQNLHLGWLTIDGQNWEIENLGKYDETKHRIGYSEIDNKFKTEFCNKRQNSFREIKTAEGKYKHFHLKSKTNEIDGSQLVFTGSASRNKEKEFLFPNSNSNNEKISLSTDVVKDFKFVYKDQDSNSINDWKFWKKRGNLGHKIPIFFNYKVKNVLHIGLPMMYKVPFKYGVYDFFPKVQDQSKSDLAELIFGYTNENELKGRIFLSNAYISSDHCTDEIIGLILGSPKASYYPFYIEQFKDVNSYNTYNDSNAVIRGHKNYPIHETMKSVYELNPNMEEAKNDKNESVSTWSFFKPLPANSEFKTTIRFHNLRPIELGALLSAISFHGSEEECYHSLGMAKPYGYGAVKLVVSSLELYENASFTKESNSVQYINEFEKLLTDNKCWEPERLNELILMASQSASNLGYMHLNDFKKVKGQKKKLGTYSEELKKNKI